METDTIADTVNPETTQGITFLYQTSGSLDGLDRIIQTDLKT